MPNTEIENLQRIRQSFTQERRRMAADGLAHNQALGALADSLTAIQRAIDTIDAAIRDEERMQSLPGFTSRKIQSS